MNATGDNHVFQIKGIIIGLLVFPVLVLKCNYSIAREGNSYPLDTIITIDYNKQFPTNIRKQGNYADNIHERVTSNNLPFLEIGKVVPNGGGIRSFYNKTFKQEGQNFCDIFEESPYQTSAPMSYYRFSWCTLEDNNGNYLFEEVLEPLFVKCVTNKARLSIGLLINSYSTEMEYAGFTKDKDGSIRKYSVPTYIFNYLQQSDYPMIKDDLYAHWWSANLDSPYLYERFEALVKSLNQWLEGKVKGTKIKRRDVIFAIEERYIGYWGEGGLINATLPQTSLINKYHDLLADLFYDKVLIAPGQLLNHLPNKKAKFNDSEIIIMDCVYNMLSKGTNVCATGLFRDSWKGYDDRFDVISQRVLRDKEGNNIHLANYLQEVTYKNGYTTGEFGYIKGADNLEPYQCLYNSFKIMRMNGISVHNYTITSGLKKIDSNPYYHYGRDILSVTGYRIVMGIPTITENPDKTYSVSIPFSNIGTSKMIADYYKPHLILRSKRGRVIKEFVSDFDMRTVEPTDNLELGEYNPQYATIMTYTIPKLSWWYNYVELYLRIDDEKGIEYPMTLSNYGRYLERQGGDGSYKLGIVK